MKQNIVNKIGILKKPIRALGISIFEITYIIIYLIVIVAAMEVIHETGHILGALAVGIPLTGIKIGMSGLNPEVIIPSLANANVSNAQREVSYYAGGFLAAAFLLGIYFLLIYRKYHKQPTWLYWTLGFITAAITTEQIGNAIVEGGFHPRYIYYSNTSTNVLYTILLIFSLFGFVFHYYFFHFPKSKRKNSE